MQESNQEERQPLTGYRVLDLSGTVEQIGDAPHWKDAVADCVQRLVGVPERP